MICVNRPSTSLYWCVFTVQVLPQVQYICSTVQTWALTSCLCILMSQHGALCCTGFTSRTYSDTASCVSYQYAIHVLAGLELVLGTAKRCFTSSIKNTPKPQNGTASETELGRQLLAHYTGKTWQLCLSSTLKSLKSCLGSGVCQDPRDTKDRQNINVSETVHSPPANGLHAAVKECLNQRMWLGGN